MSSTTRVTVHGSANVGPRSSTRVIQHEKNGEPSRDVQVRLHPAQTPGQPDPRPGGPEATRVFVHGVLSPEEIEALRGQPMPVATQLASALPPVAADPLTGDTTRMVVHGQMSEEELVALRASLGKGLVALTEAPAVEALPPAPGSLAATRVFVHEAPKQEVVDGSQGQGSS